MRRIFEPFFATKTETGTGLGMWVVTEFLERNQGRVHVRSSQRPGANGTVFSVFFPIGDTVAAASRMEDTASPEPEAALPAPFLVNHNT
jgi:signal transduction histidine kinase